MLGFQVYPTTELPGNLKDTKMREGEIKSLIKTERSHIAFAIFGILHDGNRDICT
jgi:hypothetical protein